MARQSFIETTLRNVVLCSWLVFVLNPVSAGILDYNLMNCMDFMRHIGSTVPSRFGMFGGETAAVGAAEAGAAVGAAAAAGAKRQSLEGLQNVVSSVTNVGSANQVNCQSGEPHGFCVSIDNYLQQSFPEWFFDYKVTNNVNHVVGQMTTHRYHSVFEAGLKFYKCFCEC